MPSSPMPSAPTTASRTPTEQLAHDGRLRQAVDARTAALALAPDHEPSRATLQRLRRWIDRESAEHVRRGWYALERQNTVEARGHFRAALARDPDSRSAEDGLVATSPAAASGAATQAPDPGTRPVLARLVRAVASIASGQETQKPDVLYAAARAHLAAGRDEQAYHSLVQLERSNPGYGDSATLLRRIRARLVREHYHEALRLFGEERIEEAIEQWRRVLTIDPTHADARRNIDQAERMLRTLAAQPKR
jgi:tetratricopeptide (TPR) repeat protein